MSDQKAMDVLEKTGLTSAQSKRVLRAVKGDDPQKATQLVSEYLDVSEDAAAKTVAAAAKALEGFSLGLPRFGRSDD